MTTPNKTKAKTAKKPAKTNNSVSFSTNLAALDLMLTALANAGRLESIDAARVQVARSLASLVDENPLNVGLWHQYRAAEALLREVNDANDSALQELFANLETEVRNAENRKSSKSRI